MRATQHLPFVLLRRWCAVLDFTKGVSVSISRGLLCSVRKGCRKANKWQSGTDVPPVLARGLRRGGEGKKSAILARGLRPAGLSQGAGLNTEQLLGTFASS